MIPKLAKKTAHFFAENHFIREEEQEVYAYGVELLFSAVTNFALALVIGLVMHTLLPCTVFLAVFAVLRRNTGGYHAKTHFGCNAVLAVVLIAFSFLCRFLPDGGKLIAAITVLLLSPVPVALLAPAEHPNKPLEPELRTKLHRNACIILAACAAVMLPLFWLSPDVAFWVAGGMSAAVISMVTETFLQRKKR
ncbi:MAG TPA: hypothetical protein DDX71_07735 [Ruminococcus sp.]|nr:hypothetical protein [Ruminococcus sp.]